MARTRARRVRRHAPPVLGAAVADLGRYDHVDAVSVDLPAGTDAVGFTRLVLTSTPRWASRLLAVRDRAVAPFGLKTRERVRSADVRIEPGRKVGPFRLLTVAADEVLCGDDDKHLAFRVSFALRPVSYGTGLEGVCTTVVRFERPVGRLYFRAIEPFHHLIVRAMVGRAVRT
ncbi:DUF2867 domain-containing protein [Streptomyces pseudovenezuelae]|uniref:DUF2867 domain-containing protein n=1 Tax=Streptomyces pseudovenezuelae TaxID=67350 RepID=A0ABT6LRN2_9ACTN|nr:DUF2867 domain-containing protein [Streptomyces pseudovenezuelae]MDH6218908.1 hypothetical protein [Streptomyces pseudovenezuelae]